MFPSSFCNTHPWKVLITEYIANQKLSGKLTFFPSSGVLLGCLTYFICCCCLLRYFVLRWFSGIALAWFGVLHLCPRHVASFVTTLSLWGSVAMLLLELSWTAAVSVLTFLPLWVGGLSCWCGCCVFVPWCCFGRFVFAAVFRSIRRCSLWVLLSGCLFFVGAVWCCSCVFIGVFCLVLLGFVNHMFSTCQVLVRRWFKMNHGV